MKRLIQFDDATHKVVPIEPTEEMVEATFAGMAESQDCLGQIARREVMKRRLVLAIAATMTRSQMKGRMYE